MKLHARREGIAGTSGFVQRDDIRRPRGKRLPPGGEPTLPAGNPILPANGPLILFNGARVWDRDARKYVHGADLTREDALAALDLAKSVPESHVNLYVDDEIFISHRSKLSVESDIKDGVPHTVVGDLSAWLSEREANPIKLMLISEPENLERFAGKFLRASNGSTNLIHSERTYLELTRKGVNKGTALEALMRVYGLSRQEVISFGDNLNDVELLRLSGLGVAMENALPEVKAVAGAVIGPHTGPAIQRFLDERFFSGAGASGGGVQA